MLFHAKRRIAMTLLAVGLAGLLAGCQTSGLRTLSAAEANGLRISAIRVDVAPLVQQGWGANAERVKARLDQELRTAFADRLDPSSRASLSVRVTGVTLSTFVDDSTGGFMGGGSSDYMETQTMVLIGGVEQARYPVLSALPSNSAGPWYLPGIDQRRLAALASHHAAWLRNTIIGR